MEAADGWDCGDTAGLVGVGAQAGGIEVKELCGIATDAGMALVLEGTDRTTAARSCGMDRQTLRDWVHRYDSDGLAGLENKPLPGRSPKLTAEQRLGLVALVEAGPQPGKDKVVRWRRTDLRDRLEKDFGVVLHERTVGKLLAGLGYRRLSVRPFNPKSDPVAQADFKKASQRMSPKSCPRMRAASRLRYGCRTRPGSDSRAR